MRVSIQQEPFCLANELESFTAANTAAGAVVSFTGIVRSEPENPLEYMLIEHYPGMTEKTIIKFMEKATTRWNLKDYLIIHRFGKLNPGENIVLVVTSSKHRRDAFDAADYLMDYLKSRAPFWKKEVSEKGVAWVESKPSDEIALKRWK